jgi:hypothetical protein
MWFCFFFWLRCVARVRFGQAPTLPVLAGGVLIVAGGVIISVYGK